MKTIVLEEPGRLTLTDTAEPVGPGPGEALVRIRRVGVCGTDLHAFRGEQPFFRYPRILGHELGVEVEEVGAGEAGLRAGDRCAVEPYLTCGRCAACRRGKTNCCTRLRCLGVHTDGGMRPYLVVPTAKLHRSEALSAEHLALVEMLCIGAHAVRRGGPAAGEAVLVIGAGPIGLSVAAFARAEGADVAVLELSPARLAFCRTHLGIEKTVDAREDPAEGLRAHFGGDLPTLVFDATGSARSMMQAFDYVEHGGRLVYVGLFQGDVTFHDPDFHRKEMTLMSSRNATAEDFARVIRALEAGEVDLAPWITHRVPFEQAPAAFPGWLEPESGVIKAMIEV